MTVSFQLKSKRQRSKNFQALITRIKKSWQTFSNLTRSDKFLLVIMALSLVPNKLFISPRYAIDSSWQIAVNNAFAKEYVFGRDMVFTYGPLGFLSYGLPTGLGVLAIGIILYKLFIVSGLFWIGWKALMNQQALFGKLIVVIVFVFCGKFYPFDPTMFVLMFITLGCIRSLYKPDWRWLYLLGIISVVSFFVKLNSGFIGFFFVLITLIFLCIRKQIRIRHAITMMSIQLALAGLLLFLLKVDLTGYVQYGLAIINYYNDSMVFPLLLTSVTPISAVLLAVLLIVFYLKAYGRFTDKLQWATSGFLATAFFFILFKQGFTGAATNHQLIFFSAIPFFFMGHTEIIPISPNKEIRESISYLAIFFTVCAVFNIGYMPFHSRWLRDLYMKEPVTVMEMPARIKQKIGMRSVDIFPSDIDKLYFAGLNYTTRPIPQGYSVYHRSLDAVNAAFYRSRKAPEFVVYGIGSLPGRHPFWDETQTMLSLRNNYSIADSFEFTNDNLPPELSWFYLLKKQMHEAGSPDSLLFHYTGKLNQQFPVPTSETPILMRVKAGYSFLNQVKRFFFHPQQLFCTITYVDGSSSVHLAILPILENGVIINKKILSNREASWLFNSGLQPLNVKSISFNGSPIWFKEKLEVEFFRTSSPAFAPKP